MKLETISISIYLKRSNVGKKKYYASDYSELKKRIKIDNKVLQRIANSRYVKHFYSDDEIRYIIDRWC